MAHSTSLMKAVPDYANQLVEDLPGKTDIANGSWNVGQRDMIHGQIFHQVEMITSLDPSMYSDEARMWWYLSEQGGLS